VTRKNHNGSNNQVSGETRQVLNDIKDKLDKSPALNGEFDTLIHKVDKIEQSNGNLSKKVDQIYESIYDHETGIIAKMKENKSENDRAHDKTNSELSSMNEWKKDREKMDEKISMKLDKMDTVQETVKDLVTSKNTTWAAVKWMLAAIGGGIVTVLSRYILHILTR
jgi:chromosome segregation ATPase